MSTATNRRSSERGTAVTETLMLTWIIIVFVAGSFQIFRVNQAIYLSITTAHWLMFEGAWAANCYKPRDGCVYNSDGHAQVKWKPDKMPEILVKKVGMLASRLTFPMQLKAWPLAAAPRADGFKRTRMGAGAYYPICDCSYDPFATCMSGRSSASRIPCPP